MTIPSTPRRAGPYYGTAAQTVWPFSFKIFEPADLAVITTSSTGVETTLVLDSDYSVTLNDNQDTSPGGTVLYPLVGAPMAPGNRLSIVGDLDYDQPMDIPEGGNFSPEALENELDRIVMQIQQLREVMRRAITISAGSEPTTGTTLPSPGPSQLIGWNNSGSGLQNYDPSDLIVTGLYADWVYDTFTGNGTTTTFGLQRAPGTVGNTDVSVDGQTYVPNTDFTVNATNLVFNVAPPTGAQILVRYGSAAPQGPVVGAFLRQEEMIAAAGQSVFVLSGGYQVGVGALSVYVNGQRATRGYDYLETNSTTVTFTSGLALNDRVLFLVGTEVTTGMPGDPGEDGRGIVSIIRTAGTGAAGSTDTYTITFTDATTSAFTVVNGADGTNGANGRGITTVERTSGTGAPGTTDTYTITFTDATTSTFTVYNGANGTGSGDVVGPASSTANAVAVFSGTTGKLLADSAKALPAGAIVGTSDTQTLTAKTLTNPAINGGTHTALTSLGVRNAGTGAFDMTIAYSGTLTADRTLTWNLNDAARTISLAGNITTAGALTTAGAFALTLTTTAATNVTFPTTGTLATRAGTETLSNKTLATASFTGTATFQGVRETFITANTGTAYTVANTAGSILNLTLTDNCVFTYPTPASGGQFTLLLAQDATGGRTATWPATVRWPGGTAPTITGTASRTDVISFVSDGTYWLGFVGGQNFTRA